MCCVSPPQGKARAAEIVSPAGSSARVIESAGTPGSATCTWRCWTLGNDLRAYKVIGRLGLELHLERRAKAPGGEICVDQWTQRERNTQFLGGRFQRKDVGGEMRPAR